MVNYENRIVLFLDILGFQSIIDKTIENGVDNSDRINNLYETLQLMKDEVSRVSIGNSTVITQFSDSIVISFRENDTKKIPSFFRSILSLVMKLIERGIMCRGAISYGKLFHTDDFVFGPALNEAYLTESTAAIYPRVILDKSVVDVLKTNYETQEQDILSQMRLNSLFESVLKIDTDNKFYIDFFIGALVFGQDQQIINYFNKLRKFISSGQGYKTPSINIKYGWLRNKYNNFISELNSGT